MKRFRLFFIGVSLLGALFAKPSPQVELSASSTNLVLTEETRIVVRLWMPPLEDGFEELPPILNQRPPHVSAAFLEKEWNPAAIEPADPNHLPPIAFRSRDRNLPVYTLNNYVSNDVFGGMRDPFSLFEDDDFFARAMGPKPGRFPFAASRAERDGVNGWEFVIETFPYRAVAPGRVNVSPVVVKLPVITRVQTKRDPLGRAVHVPVLKEVKLQTRSLVIDVSEPPTVGRPNDYCGAIASNLTVSATLDASVCTAGDPLVLTLDISGAGNAASVSPSSFASLLKSGGVFRLDEASLKTETLATSRRFSWRVRALKAGTVEFPSLPVSYYNLGKRDYVTLKTQTIPVQVKAGAQATLGALDEANESETEFPCPDGIDFDLRGAGRENLLPHGILSVVLFLAAPIVFLFIRLMPPMRRRVAVRREMRRRATAFSKCKKGLRSRNSTKRETAIRQFFSDRYDVNGATVTAADARRLMANDFTGEEINLIESALAEADCAAYSGMTKKVVSLLLLCVLPFALCAASTDFTYRRACSLAARAADETDFKKSADAFADCVRAGAANPILFENLGATSLMGGDLRGARIAYRRAECWGGETASTRRGLRATEARAKNDPRADLALTRIFFAPHYKFSLDVRLLFAAACWTVCWLVALLPGGALRRFVLTLAALTCLASLVSVSVSLAEEHLAERVMYADR